MTLPRRRIVRQGPLDPADHQRTLYELECGHWVSRKTKGAKRNAACGICRC